MCRSPNCTGTGCPYRDPEMIAIMRDSHGGRLESLGRRMDAITLRVLTAHGAKPTHSAYRALRSRAATSPTTQDLVSAINTFRSVGRERGPLASSRIETFLKLGHSTPVSTMRNAATPHAVPAAPDLAAAIRAARKE